MTLTAETEPSILTFSSSSSSEQRRRCLKKPIKLSNEPDEASFSDVERVVLRALLLDTEETPTNDTDRVFTDEMLFSLPPSLTEDGKHNVPHQHAYHDSRVNSGTKTDSGVSTQAKRPSVKKKPRDYRLLVGLWQAHEDGVAPGRLTILKPAISFEEPEGAKAELGNEEVGETRAYSHILGKENDEGDGNNDVDSTSSQEEVRDDLSHISWNEDEGGFDHFDAWQILKDEYALDFGFDYKSDGKYVNENELSYNTFKIIGTSADDKSAHPHVLSPPLMDSLMNFLPDQLQGQNYWMKYSLIRDGASLDTFRAYARASKDNILAIETTRGDVFGVYTSSHWHTSPHLFGGSPSFVWRMRHSRTSPCHSLFEQAQMESEIDVYFLLDKTVRIQTCTHDRLGVGVGNMNKYDGEGKIIQTEQEEEQKNGKNYGFAIALEDDLLSGTTSRSPSYKNPCLCDPSSNGEVFQVLNVELWSLTPAFSEDSAERLELTSYWFAESIRNTSRSFRSLDGRESSSRSSRNLDQESFYRKLGHDDEHEELRDQWQYRRMMDGAGVSNGRAVGSSPRFTK